MRPASDNSPTGGAPGLELLQSLVDHATGNAVRLHHPLWQTTFRIQHRHAAHYRTGRIFVAGDAAHVHSPAGAQGMNTGIQDAVNLAWKLALVAQGQAPPELLDTYETERQPIGRAVVRFTDRAFTIATSTRGPVAFIRARLAPQLLGLAARIRVGRARAFRALAELDINYRTSPAVTEGRPALRRGPHAGDRFPDAPVELDGKLTTLHRALADPSHKLLLVGPSHTWSDQPALTHPALQTHRLATQAQPGALTDPTGQAHRLLGVNPDRCAHYLIRPDGHIAYRAAGTDLSGVATHLHHWLSAPTTATCTANPRSPNRPDP